MILRIQIFALLALYAGLTVSNVFGSDIRVLTGRVQTVDSGDTVTIHTSSQLARKVRLAGIDAPEKDQPFFRECLRALSNKVLGQDVRIHVTGEPDRKHYEVVGNLYLGKRWINGEMVLDGVAWHDSRDQTDKRLVAAQAVARREKRGLWQQSSPTAPWSWVHPSRKGSPGNERREPRNSDRVYLCETSNKYHKKSCHRLRGETEEVTRKTAEKWSYKPCPVCKP